MKHCCTCKNYAVCDPNEATTDCVERLHAIIARIRRDNCNTCACQHRGYCYALKRDVTKYILSGKPHPRCPLEVQ